MGSVPLLPLLRGQTRDFFVDRFNGGMVGFQRGCGHRRPPSSGCCAGAENANSYYHLHPYLNNRVPFMFKEKIRQVWSSLCSFAVSLPGWARQNYVWGLLIVPCLFVVLMYYISGNNIFGWQNSSYCKNDLEIIHPSLLACALLLAAVGWIKTRDFSLTCLFFLCAGAFSREILGQGYSSVFVIAIIGVIVCADQNRERIKTLINSKWASSFLATTFICYIASQLLDRGVVKRIGWLVTMDTSWKPLYSSNIEESLEALGGLFLVLTVLTLIVSAIKRKNSE
jgi:hypothetical protein